MAAQIEEYESAAIVGTPNDLALHAICQVPQLTPSGNPGDFSAQGSCKAAIDPGWCYVAGAAAGACPEAAVVTPSGALAGAQLSLYCSPTAQTGAAP